MRRFAQLYAALDDTRATLVKLAAMHRYFATTPPEDAAWGLFFLLGNRLKRVIPSSRLRTWLGEATALPDRVIEESYAHVGDLGETIALLFDRDDRHEPAEDLPLHVCVERLQALQNSDETAQREFVTQQWRELPFLECLLFNKLLTGSLRVGVSAGLAARALAEHAGIDTPLMQARLMGDWKPGVENFATLLARDASSRPVSQPYPFCLASPLEDAPASLGDPADFLVEWKWDGIRGQLIRREGQTFLWSRGEELLDGRFPEIEAAAASLPDGTVLDGEVLAWNAQGVMPFAVLQKRIGRKTLGKKVLADAPVVFRAYDLIEWQGEDWRTRPLSERRDQLERLLAGADPAAALQLSDVVRAADWSDLALLRETARERGVEGLMLKRLDTAYLAGRKRGSWWKWKVGALTVDTVLLYAQSGHGRRSNLYTDYTLAVRDGEALVPVAKAYSGLTDEELNQMDRWIRAHTLEKFGPVRSVEALQVFEIAFEGIQASSRHKAGVALRFPRIARWRRDKAVADIDTLDDLKKLLPSP
ncbi:DNA ligase-1 [Panacagrimonas perspica]|uniref:DNA ligase (ATP) n=1 Tax=Panacagrimonas perspica TaxID=381431 RepID=A0A4V3UR32_9GAMM|nr:ATP-dependent DNA ligase [Panacagrimonas perspica]TDU23252.1 DNA ligase-1 [Panacagrimonas perspica]THD01351.1 ATP-dependent DNA ligase [Panacagrimonas perspica]